MKCCQTTRTLRERQDVVLVFADFSVCQHAAAFEPMTVGQSISSRRIRPCPLFVLAHGDDQQPGRSACTFFGINNLKGTIYAQRAPVSAGRPQREAGYRGP
jgi:hypothetical protein